MWPRRRNVRFVGAPQAIDTTNGNTFWHGYGRVPGEVVVRFVCVTANNGYVPGDEIPETAIYRAAGSNTDGRPFCVWRVNKETVKVYVSSASVDFQDSAFTTVTFTPSQWNVVVRCSDIEEL